MPSKPCILFEIVPKGSDISHYLFGTMHMDNEDAYAHVDISVKYLERCENYFAEMDLASADLEEMGKYFLLENGITLDQLFKKNHYFKIRKILLKSFGIDLNNFNNFIPFYIQTLIAEKVLNSRQGLPLDFYLWQKALNSEKNMGGVETFEDQTTVLQKIPLDMQIKSLRIICKNISSYSKQLKLLSKEYRNKEVGRIYTLSKKQLGPLKKLLLYDRNVKMMLSINEKCKDASSFFAVGAAHLYGSKGILNLLKTQGYKIKPVFF
jgi:uncharacterized protein YbaP (TraB family)